VHSPGAVAAGGAGVLMSTFAPTVGVSSTRPSDMPVEHAELPVWNAENWFYEDWPVGQKIRSLRRTISEGESHQFNTLVLDIHPYVQDHMFAEREGIFDKRLVAGAFVFSAGLGLVATNCINAFSYGYDKLRFIKPVFIGDTIYTIRTNMDKKPRYAEMGLIRASYEIFKGEGELVLYCEHLQTVKYKDPAAFADQIEK
jgi:acyl dehydratase